MHDTVLPALVGTDPLGFLSALGTFRLLAEHDVATRLSWDRASGSAIMRTTMPSVEAIGDWLVDLVLGLRAPALLPGVEGEYPFAKEGSRGKDPMRPPRKEFRALANRTKAQGGAEALRWLEVITTDLAEDKEQKAGLTPWMAPSGQQTARSFFKTSLDLISRNPELLRDALTDWRRSANYSGEYLDHRALNDAAASPGGKSIEMGAPGPTWLATMALPLLRTVGDGKTTLSTLWHRIPLPLGVRGRAERWAVWPLWDPPLDVHAVRVLLEHPELRPELRPSAQGPSVRMDRLAALGVFRVAAARRRSIEGRKSGGVLGPVAIAMQ